MNYPSRAIINISPPKCGTTGLFHAFVESPDVARPRLKEPRFFVDREPEFEGLPEAAAVKGHYGNTVEWFWKLFPTRELARARFAIEFSTYNSVSRVAPERVQ